VAISVDLKRGPAIFFAAGPAPISCGVCSPLHEVHPESRRRRHLTLLGDPSEQLPPRVVRSYIYTHARVTP